MLQSMPRADFMDLEKIESEVLAYLKENRDIGGYIDLQPLRCMLDDIRMFRAELRKYGELFPH